MPTKRHRLAADVSEATSARVRQTADRFYAGAMGETINAALDVFNWVIGARTQGKRVIATAEDVLPATFEEPRIPALDAAGAEWRWLVARDHPWRRQLWIKGRSITAGSLARTIEIEGWTPERAAEEFDLPTDAVLEAIRYLGQARDLVAAEEAEDRMAAAASEGLRAAAAR
jgi:hypothetical protein